LQAALVAFLSSILTVGCGTVSPAARTNSTSPDSLLIEALQQRPIWSVRGGIGIWTDEQNVTASMRWVEDGSALDVTLSAPLGLGIMRVTETAQGAMLQRGAEKITGSTANNLVQRALNLWVPAPMLQLSFLMRWLSGSANEASYDDTGRLASLRYTDAAGNLWRATVRRYANVDGLSVPALITAKGGPYNVRLILKNWKFGPTNPDVRPALNDSEGRLSIPGRSS